MPEVRLLTAFLVLLPLLACTTRQAYEGPTRVSGEIALIQGDPKFRIAPVSAFLRAVDGKVLRDTQASAAVLPGEHELIVDCVVEESGDRQRIQLQVVVQAGKHYRLEPQLGSANQYCETVRLIGADP